MFQCLEEPPPLFGLSLFYYTRSDIIGIMSQKVVIERVQVRGAAPYLGMSATPDGRPVERGAGHALRSSGKTGMLMACGHARNDSAVPEPDREHGLVEREQASQDAVEETYEPGNDAQFQETA